MERQVNRYVRQLSAMHLILSMRIDPVPTGHLALPNIEYMLNRTTTDAPPKYDELDEAKGDFTYLRDMFYLFDSGMYQAYYAMVHKPTSLDMLTAAMSNTSFVIEGVTKMMKDPEARFWSGTYPHCPYILREVVAQLLA